MAATSAVELKAACDSFISQLLTHHGTMTDMKGQFEGHLGTWFESGTGWIDAEINKVQEEYQQMYIQFLQNFIDWLEQHHTTFIPNIALAVENLTRDVTG